MNKELGTIQLSVIAVDEHFDPLIPPILINKL